MKISYISSSCIPSKAANSIHVMKMCQAFARKGHDVTLISMMGRSKGITRDNIFDYYDVRRLFKLQRFYTTSVRFIRPLLYGAFALMYIKKQEPDLVYSRDITGAYLAAQSGLPVVYELHDSLVGSPKEKVFKKFLRTKTLKKVVVISQALKNHVQQKYDIDDNVIMVAHDAADPVEEIHSTNDPSAQLVNERMQVGYIGHLYQGRGVDIIIEMAGQCPWADFHLVGGTDEDIRYWKAIASNQQNLFFHGFLPHGEAAKVRQHCNVLLAPYQKKVSVAGNRDNTAQWMSPLKIFEYMSSGKPIICSDIPVLREVLRDGENALLCVYNDAIDWVKALERLRDDKELTKRLSSKALEDFNSKHTWIKRAELVLDGLTN